MVILINSTSKIGGNNDLSYFRVINIILIIMVITLSAVSTNSFSDETSDNKSKFNELYKQVNDRYEKGNWSRAIEYYNEATKLDPTVSELYIKLEYERNGKNYYTRNAELEPDLTSLSILKVKFLGQRAIPDDERGLCMW